MSQLTKKETATANNKALYVFEALLLNVRNTTVESILRIRLLGHISEGFLGLYINDVCCFRSISAMFIFTNSNP